MNDAALLEAFADALREEPPALEAAARAELVRAALAEIDDEALVDAFADALRTEPPAEVAEEAPSRREPLATRRWTYAAVAASLVFAVGAGMWAQLLWSDTGVQPEGGLVEHRLAAGHRIHATAATTLAIEEGEDAVRVRLTSGQALFDVAPGSDFLVEAGTHHVRVTGTVFTVARAGDDVSVRVYEGSVRVDRGDATRALQAGEALGREPSDERIASLAEAAARRRLAQATVEPAPEPPRAPPVEPAEIPLPVEQVEPPRPGAPVVELGAVRRALSARRYRAALSLLDRAPGPNVERDMLRGDALRGLERHDEALAAYRRALRRGVGAERPVAGLEGARVLAGPLRRPLDARAMLTESGALDEGSPVLGAARRLDARLGSR